MSNTANIATVSAEDEQEHDTEMVSRDHRYAEIGKLTRELMVSQTITPILEQGNQAILDNDPEKALKLLEEAQQICEEHQPEDITTITVALQLQAKALKLQKKYDAAETLLLNAITLQPEEIDEDDFFRVKKAFLFSHLYAMKRDLGQIEEALDYLNEFFKIAEQVRNAGISKNIDFFIEAGLLHMDCKHYQPARDNLGKAVALLKEPYPGGSNDRLIAQLMDLIDCMDDCLNKGQADRA